MEAHAHYCRMVSRCFIVRKFMSRKRSTQFAKQVSSDRSSFDPLIEPVTHFFQQTSVNECVSIARKKKAITLALHQTSLQKCPENKGRISQREKKGREVNLHPLKEKGIELAGKRKVRERN
jgi:hypothetical protein